MDFLAGCEFEVEYRPGSSNKDADFLSRAFPAESRLTFDADEGYLVAALNSAAATKHPDLEP